LSQEEKKSPKGEKRWFPEKVAPVRDRPKERAAAREGRAATQYEEDPSTEDEDICER
jgi:hypothetical protein